MQVVFSEIHRQHAIEVHLPGCPAPCFEIPSRADSILSAVTAAQVGQVIEPQDFGLGPIHAVHSEEFVEYLKTAYQSSRQLFKGQQPAIAEEYSERGWRNKPGGLPGGLGLFDILTTYHI